MDIRVENLEPGCFYHIYNRGINSCKVFLNDDNRLFFLKKFKEYLVPYAEIYAYCLMPTHFHFVIRVKEPEETLKTLPKLDDTQKTFAKLYGEKTQAKLEEELPKFETLPKLDDTQKTLAKLDHEPTNKTFIKSDNGLHADKSIVSKQFAKLISSYTQAFNKYHHRHGSLFERPFKRRKIDSEEYLRQSIIYVHRNVLDLNLKLDAYDFCSYKSITSNKPTAAIRDEVIELFSDLDNFVLVHKKDGDYSVD